MTPTSLRALTKRFVQSSSNHVNARPTVKATIDALVTAGCRFLLDIGPQVKPARKAEFVRAYQRGLCRRS